jgi:hypothetical protein
MYIRVVYTAKMGKDRDTREAGIFTNSRGEMHMNFDKDIDWSEPVFMILEPAEAMDVDVYTEKDFYEDVDELKAQRVAPRVLDHYLAKKVEAESKRHVTNNKVFDDLMKKGDVE